jgi:phosphoribosylaminoimidazole carboxylase PurE protein
VALAKKAGLIFIDTKYEFGRDSNGNLFLIDESNTPDSSRFCSEEEYNLKMPQIIEAMGSKKYKTVIELTKDEEHPELKIKEGSKQFVRDVLREGGYEEGKSLPPLTDEQIIETSWRYIDAYERITGQEFIFVQSEYPTKQRILKNLIKAGYLKYSGCVVPIGASAKSESDKAHWEKMKEALISEGVPFADIAYYSAHKQTQELLDYVKKMDLTSIQPLIYLTFAGGSNGLGPVVAGNTKYPVITCPVFRDKADYHINIFSSLEAPSKLPLGVVVSPGNAVLLAKRILEMGKIE